MCALLECLGVLCAVPPARLSRFLLRNTPVQNMDCKNAGGLRGGQNFLERWRNKREERESPQPGLAEQRC